MGSDHEVKGILGLADRIYGLSKDGRYLYEWFPALDQNKGDVLMISTCNCSTNVYELADPSVKYMGFCDLTFGRFSAMYFSEVEIKEKARSFIERPSQSKNNILNEIRDQLRIPDRSEQPTINIKERYKEILGEDNTVQDNQKKAIEMRDHREESARRVFEAMYEKNRMTNEIMGNKDDAAEDFRAGVNAFRHYIKTKRGINGGPDYVSYRSNSPQLSIRLAELPNNELNRNPSQIVNNLEQPPYKAARKQDYSVGNNIDSRQPQKEVITGILDKVQTIRGQKRSKQFDNPEDATKYNEEEKEIPIDISNKKGNDINPKKELVSNTTPPIERIWNCLTLIAKKNEASGFKRILKYVEKEEMCSLVKRELKEKKKEEVLNDLVKMCKKHVIRKGLENLLAQDNVSKDSNIKKGVNKTKFDKEKSNKIKYNSTEAKLIIEFIKRRLNNCLRRLLYGTASISARKELLKLENELKEQMETQKKKNTAIQELQADVTKLEQYKTALKNISLKHFITVLMLAYRKTMKDNLRCMKTSVSKNQSTEFINHVDNLESKEYGKPKDSLKESDRLEDQKDPKKSIGRYNYGRTDKTQDNKPKELEGTSKDATINRPGRDRFNRETRKEINEPTQRDYKTAGNKPQEVLPNTSLKSTVGIDQDKEEANSALINKQHNLNDKDVNDKNTVNKETSERQPIRRREYRQDDKRVPTWTSNETLPENVKAGKTKDNIEREKNQSKNSVEGHKDGEKVSKEDQFKNLTEDPKVGSRINKERSAVRNLPDDIKAKDRTDKETSPSKNLVKDPKTGKIEDKVGKERSLIRNLPGEVKVKDKTGKEISPIKNLIEDPEAEDETDKEKDQLKSLIEDPKTDSRISKEKSTSRNSPDDIKAKDIIEKGKNPSKNLVGDPKAEGKTYRERSSVRSIPDDIKIKNKIESGKSPSKSSVEDPKTGARTDRERSSVRNLPDDTKAKDKADQDKNIPKNLSEDIKTESKIDKERNPSRALPEDLKTKNKIYEEKKLIKNLPDDLEAKDKSNKDENQSKDLPEDTAIEKAEPNKELARSKNETTRDYKSSRIKRDNTPDKPLDSNLPIESYTTKKDKLEPTTNSETKPDEARIKPISKTAPRTYSQRPSNQSEARNNKPRLHISLLPTISTSTHYQEDRITPCNKDKNKSKSNKSANTNPMQSNIPEDNKYNRIDIEVDNPKGYLPKRASITSRKPLECSNIEPINIISTNDIQGDNDKHEELKGNTDQSYDTKKQQKQGVGKTGKAPSLSKFIRKPSDANQSDSGNVITKDNPSANIEDKASSKNAMDNKTVKNRGKVPKSLEGLKETYTNMLNAPDTLLIDKVRITDSDDFSDIGMADPVELETPLRSLKGRDSIDLDNKPPAGRYDHKKFINSFSNCFIKYHTQMVEEEKGKKVPKSDSIEPSSDRVNKHIQPKTEDQEEYPDVKPQSSLRGSSSFARSKFSLQDSQNKDKAALPDSNTSDASKLYKTRLNELNKKQRCSHFCNANAQPLDSQGQRKSVDRSLELSASCNCMRHSGSFSRPFDNSSSTSRKNLVSARDRADFIELNKRFVSEMSQLNHEINSQYNCMAHMPRLKVRNPELVLQLAKYKTHIEDVSKGSLSSNTNAAEKRAMDVKERLSNEYSKIMPKERKKHLNN